MSVSGGDSPEAALSSDSQYILKSIFLKLPVKGPQFFQTLERLSMEQALHTRIWGDRPSGVLTHEDSTAQ